MSNALFSNTKSRRRAASSGFTLVEILVIAPLAVITIAVLVGAMVAMVGDALIAQRSAAASYDLQNTLDRIESDARMSSAFLDRFALLPAGQGRNATPTAMTDTTSFESSLVNASKADLILNAPATTSNPFDAERRIVYYQDQPNPCGATAYLNRPLSTKIIYFTRDDGKSAGTQTLWRRTVIPAWNRNSTADSQTICDIPWQRDSCPKMASPDCTKVDEKMLENVTNFQITYLTPSQTVETSSSRNADAIRVNISVKDTAAGKSINQSGTTVSHRTAGSVDEIPANPVIYVDSPEDNMLNNPRKATFGWQSTAFGGIYTVQYSTNGGTTWSTPNDTANTRLSVPVYPGDPVRIRVTAKNDMGSSAQATYSYTVPQWTYINLSNGWECYQPAETTWSCPQYTITKTGIVIYRGLAKNGADGVEMFSLPSEMRPQSTKTQTYNAESTYQAGRIDVNADDTAGKVVWRKSNPSAASTYVSLDNVRYPASNVSWTTATLNSVNGWTHTGFQWGNVEYAKDAQNRTWIQGWMCGSTTVATGQRMLTLPSGFQESNTETAIHANQSLSGNTAYQLTSGSAAQLQNRGSGETGACFGGAMNISTTYHSTTTTAASVSAATTGSFLFGSTWTNYSAAWMPLMAHKGGAGDNIVSLRGLLKDSAAPAQKYSADEVLATLPTGYRPSKQLLFYSVGRYYDSSSNSSKEGMARIHVGTDGVIRLIYSTQWPADGRWVSLEGIHFLADGT